MENACDHGDRVVPGTIDWPGSCRYIGSNTTQAFGKGMEMIRRFWMAIGAIATLAALYGCDEANPFTLVIDNKAEEILTLDGDTGRTSVTLFVLEDSQWREVEGWESCFRVCGESQVVCADMAAPAPGVWALMPGDLLDMEFAGTEFVRSTDIRGECQKEQAITGTVLAEVCYGRGVVDDEGNPWDEEITESGFVFDAGFEEHACAEVEFTLPEDLEVVAELTI